MDDGHVLSEFDLPRESRLLQGLARKVLADEHLADDVAQETWLTLLRNQTRELTSPKRFLKRVAHNIAVDVVRSKDRRRHREERHVRPSSSPAADELAHESNVRERMLHALDDLPEKYSEVLRLRYYESLSPPEIAESLDVPLETVRTRLKRGMAQLKRRLEREFREDPAGWPWALGALLPAGELARLSPPAGGSPSPGSTAAAPASWGVKTLFATAIAAPALLLTLAWSPWTPERASAPAATPDTVRAAPMPVREPVAVSDGRTTLNARVDVEARFEEDGSPFAGGVLELAWGDVRVRGTTDDEGRLVTEPPLAVPIGERLSIEVVSDSIAVPTTLEVDVLPAADTNALGLVVPVRARRSLAGKVVDAAGAPVSGARVLAYASHEERLAGERPTKTTRTDAQGAYLLNGLPGTFYVEAQGRKQVSLVALRGRGVHPRHFEDVDFTLASAGRFVGEALTEDGRPLKEVEIQVRSAQAKFAVDPLDGMQFVKPFRRLATDRRGRFTVEDLPHGRYTLTASRPPLVSDWSSVSLDAPTREIEFRLRQGEDVRVRLLSPQGKPVVGAKVSVWRGHVRGESDSPFGHPTPQQHETTARDGTAFFGGQLPEPPLLVIVDSKDHAPEVIGPLQPPAELEVRLQQPRRLEGRLIAPQGGPLHDAQIIVRKDLDYEAMIAAGLDRYCEESIATGTFDGVFDLERVPHGPLRILAVAQTASGATLVHETRCGAEVNQLEVVFEPSVRLSGRVTSARTQTPVSGVRVIAFSDVTGTRWDTRTGPDGNYQVELPDAPDWSLVFEKRDYARACLRPTSTEGTYDVSLSDRAELLLTIVDTEGVPIPSARVELATASGNPVLTGLREGRAWELADPMGRVMFPDAPTCVVEATVRVPALSEAQSFRLDLSELAAGQRRSRRLTLKGYASTVPSLPVTIHLQRGGVDRPQVDWGAPAAGREAYQGPIELLATDSRGHKTLGLQGQGTLPDEDAQTTSLLVRPRGPRSLNLRRFAGLERWAGSSAWSLVPVADPLSAVPLPAEAGAVHFKLGTHEVSVPLGAKGPRSSTLTVTVPAN